MTALFDHATKVFDVEFRMMFIQTFDFKTQRGSEVFFIADHNIDQRRQFAINFARAGLATNDLPERGSIIQVV